MNPIAKADPYQVGRASFAAPGLPMVTEPTFIPSERFERALQEAVQIHRRQGRKRAPGEHGAPYVGHLLSVAGYVLEDGGSEEEAIAALLHDVIEDQPREGLADDLRAKFGERVVQIVEACSQEKQPGEDPGWRGRKQRYIDHLEEADPAALRVSLSDKLRNVRAMLRDHRDEGTRLWERFNTGPDEILWYYETLADRYLRLHPGAMADEFVHEVKRLRTIAEASGD